MKKNLFLAKLLREWKDWEKIFVNHILDRGLVSGIYKELKKLIESFLQIKPYLEATTNK